MKEAFGSGTAAVISPIGELKIDEHVLQLSDGKIGPISQKLYDQLTGIQWGRVPRSGRMERQGLRLIRADLLCGQAKEKT